MSLNPDRAKLIAEGLRDHGDFCRRSLAIRNEQGVTVPLELTPAQLKLQLAIREQEKRGDPIRVVVLKARQVRMSVGACSQVFKRTAFIPGQQSMTMAHRADATENLYGYHSQFVDAYRSNPYHGLKMLAVEGGETGKSIELAGGSKLLFQTGGAVQSGRSFSFRNLHISEHAFLPDATTLMTGLLQTVPDDPLTMVIVESSPNGMGGPFYDLWQRACDSHSKSGWVAVFFAWWEEPKYSRALTMATSLFERSLTKGELELRQLYRLSLEQLNWRRWAIENKCEGDEDRFDQEYPHSPEVAFLTSGRPRFDLRSVNRMPLLREPLVGELEMQRIGTREVPQFMPREDGMGSLRVWKRPERGKRYVIGSDPSRGVDVGEDLGRTDPDWSVATVHDDTGDQVAVLRARLTPYAFADYTAALGLWFNTAYLVPEANEMGYIEALMQTGYPQTHFYTRKRDADDPRPPSAHEVGFMTTNISKTQLISQLDRALREVSIIVRDPVTAQELRTFVYLPNGRVAGQKGTHDDCVIALALAAVGLAAMPAIASATAAGQLEPQQYGGSTGDLERSPTGRRGVRIRY